MNLSKTIKAGENANHVSETGIEMLRLPIGIHVRKWSAGKNTMIQKKILIQ